MCLQCPQRRKPRHAHRLVSLREVAQTLHWISFELNGLVSRREAAIPAACAKHFRRIGAGERVAPDIFAAFDALQQKRVFRVLGDAQRSAHGREQIVRVRVVYRNEVALFRQA